MHAEMKPTFRIRKRKCLFCLKAEGRLCSLSLFLSLIDVIIIINIIVINRRGFRRFCLSNRINVHSSWTHIEFDG